jgi:hypothetical protein
MFVIYYANYIISKDTYQWNERVELAKAFAERVNRHCGYVSVVVLPDQGIYGNSGRILNWICKIR